MELRKSLIPAVAIAAVFGFAAGNTAHAGSVGSQALLFYSIDGNTDQPGGILFSDLDGDGYISGTFSYVFGDNQISGSFWTLEDPIINIAVSAIDGGLASAFSVSVQLITSIPATDYNFDLTGSGGYTDGFPRNGVGLSPVNGAVFQGFKDDVLVASAGGAQFTPNPPPGQPLSDVYGPVTDIGQTTVCALGCSSETLVISWIGTGQGDSYGLTAQFTNKPVPVPAALPLMVSAIAAVGLVGLRRKA